MDKFDYLQSLWDRLYKEGTITDDEYEKITQAVVELREESYGKAEHGANSSSDAVV